MISDTEAEKDLHIEVLAFSGANIECLFPPLSYNTPSVVHQTLGPSHPTIRQCVLCFADIGHLGFARDF